MNGVLNQNLRCHKKALSRCSPCFSAFHWVFQDLQCFSQPNSDACLDGCFPAPGDNRAEYLRRIVEAGCLEVGLSVFMKEPAIQI